MSSVGHEVADPRTRSRVSHGHAPENRRVSEALVDIVMPALNAQDTIARSIASVLDQTAGRFQLTVVDDGSVDQTREIAESVPDVRVTVLKSARRGVGAARNLGVSAGSAPMVAFLDADDTVRPDWLELLLHRHDAPLVRCGYTIVQGASETHVGTDGALLAGSFIVSRELFDSIGGYDERFRYSENTDLWLRLRHELDRRKLVSASVEHSLLHVHRHGDGTRGTKFGYEALRDAAELMLAKHTEVMSPKARASYAAVAGVNNLRLGERRRARAQLRRATRLSPRRLRYWLRLAQTYAPSTSPNSPRC